MEKPKNITEYIEAAPAEAQPNLRELLDCLRAAAPGAEESLKWGTPAFSYKWILFQVAVHKHFISFHPTPSAITAFEKELAGYQTSPSTIRFPFDQPLPLSLIREIAEFRIRESNEKGIKWM